MIRKGSAVLMAILVLAAALFGLSKRGTYTNILYQPDFLETAQIGELPEEYAKQDASNMEAGLPDSNMILRIKATGEYIPEYGIGRQMGIVQQVYRGDDVSVGQEIAMLTSKWTYTSYKGDEGTEINVAMGFVNHMEKDREYLVFLDGPAVALREEAVAAFMVADDYTMAPVFCYDTIENVIVDTTGSEYTWVDYNLVRENEFFMCTEAGLQSILELKAKMLALYPKM